MIQTTQFMAAYRLFLCNYLQENLSPNTSNIREINIPVRELCDQTVAEVFLHLNRIGYHAPQQTTADICSVSTKTVSRTINNFSK